MRVAEYVGDRVQPITFSVSSGHSVRSDQQEIVTGGSVDAQQHRGAWTRVSDRMRRACTNVDEVVGFNAPLLSVETKDDATFEHVIQAVSMRMAVVRARTRGSL